MKHYLVPRAPPITLPAARDALLGVSSLNLRGRAVERNNSIIGEMSAPERGPDFIPDATEAVIDGIVEKEGRAYTDDPDDGGGPTKFGITLETLREFRGDPTLTADDVAALDESEAREIYRSEYITEPGFDGIDDEQLRLHVIDAGVNHGVSWAARRLQEVAEADLKIDGILGDKTLAAVNAADPDKLHLLFIARRMLKYMRIVAADARKRGCFKGQIRFLEGWGKRLAWFIEDEARF